MNMPVRVISDCEERRARLLRSRSEFTELL
jgi:hypothetical protein